MVFLPLNLQTLAQTLQRRLAAEPLRVVPIRVDCVLGDRTLMVLLTHDGEPLPYPRRLFQVVRELVADERLTDTYTVLVSLRQTKEEQPYASFTLQRHGDGAALGDVFDGSPPAQEPANDAAWEDFWGEDRSASPPSTPGIRFSEAPESSPLPRSPAAPSLGFGWWLGGGCLAITMFLGTFFTLSRPCVLGRCPQLEMADQQVQKVHRLFEGSPSGQDIFQAREDLREAIALLKPIPLWSGHYNSAQDRLSILYQDLPELDTLIAGLQQAAQAATLGQVIPQPLPQWQKVQSLWAGAIADLNRVSPRSAYHNLAQTKVKVYQDNLQRAQQYIQLENQAQVKLELAQQAIQEAQGRETVANTEAAWDATAIRWQTAFDTLKEISPQVTAYETAQTLIAQHSRQVMGVKDRQTQEVFASNAYEMAQRAARQAQAAAITDRWPEALLQWQNALDSLQQITGDTTLFPQAQALIADYSQSLRQAQQRVAVLSRRQQAEADLSRLCRNGDLTICTFAFLGDRFALYFNANYVQKIRQTASQVPQEGDQLKAHLATLEQGLRLTSRNADLPLYVYDGNGVQIAVYQPQS